MDSKSPRWAALATLVATCACSSSTAPPAAQGSGPEASAKAAPLEEKPVTTPLRTRKEDLVELLHGVQVADPFRWLEDEKSDEVRAWMADKNRAARAVLEALPEREALLRRFEALHYVDSQSAPIKRRDRYFFSVRPADKEKTIYYWRQGEEGEPRVLIDVNKLSADGSVSVGEVVPSPDGRKVAYLLKGNNADESTLRVMEVDSGAISEIDVIEGLRYTAPSWTADGKGFFYTWIPRDPTIPPNERMGYGELRHHLLGTDPAQDRTVREKTGDPQRWMAAQVSKDGRFLILSISRGWSEQDVYFMRLGEKREVWEPLAVGTKALYSVRAHGGQLFIATNEGAPRWRLFAASAKEPARAKWKEIVAEDPRGGVLDDVAILGKHLVLSYLRDATSRLEVRTLAGKRVHEVRLPALGTVSAPVGDEDDDVAYFGFSSYAYPHEIHRLSVKRGQTELHFRPQVPVEPADYVVRQVRYPSKDGVEVSMFLVHRKDLEPNGEHPTILYGYGGFNISLTPTFTPLVYPWLERGGIYAVPNLRGGGEYGEAWHQAGMLGNKQNVFDDYLAAAEWLIAQRYTRSGRLGIMGRSNGGLLVGAAMTQRPDLFGAVVCGVPLLDMVRYHLFGIGRAWIPEYGTAEDPEQFGWLHAYSPYHRVKAGSRYPALLMLATDSDDRVDPLHARKFVAAVEHAAQGEHVNLLRIEANAGHGGADMRNKAAELAADQIAFLLAQLTKPSGGVGKTAVAP